jgi:hypothetical protein
MLVTMKFTDGCPDADSYVYVYDATGKEMVDVAEAEGFTFEGKEFLERVN